MTIKVGSIYKSHSVSRFDVIVTSVSDTSVSFTGCSQGYDNGNKLSDIHDSFLSRYHLIKEARLYRTGDRVKANTVSHPYTVREDQLEDSIWVSLGYHGRQSLWNRDALTLLEAAPAKPLAPKVRPKAGQVWVCKSGKYIRVSHVGYKTITYLDAESPFTHCASVDTFVATFTLVQERLYKKGDIVQFGECPTITDRYYRVHSDQTLGSQMIEHTIIFHEFPHKYTTDIKTAVLIPKEDAVYARYLKSVKPAAPKCPVAIYSVWQREKDFQGNVLDTPKVVQITGYNITKRRDGGYSTVLSDKIEKWGLKFFLKYYKERGFKKGDRVLDRLTSLSYTVREDHSPLNDGKCLEVGEHCSVISVDQTILTTVAPAPRKPKGGETWKHTRSGKDYDIKDVYADGQVSFVHYLLITVHVDKVMEHYTFVRETEKPQVQPRLYKKGDTVKDGSGWRYTVLKDQLSNSPNINHVTIGTAGHTVHPAYIELVQEAPVKQEPKAGETWEHKNTGVHGRIISVGNLYVRILANNGHLPYNVLIGSFLKWYTFKERPQRQPIVRVKVQGNTVSQRLALEVGQVWQHKNSTGRVDGKDYTVKEVTNKGRSVLFEGTVNDVHWLDLEKWYILVVCPVFPLSPDVTVGSEWQSKANGSAATIKVFEVTYDKLYFGGWKVMIGDRSNFIAAQTLLDCYTKVEDDKPNVGETWRHKVTHNRYEVRSTSNDSVKITPKEERDINMNTFLHGFEKV